MKTIQEKIEVMQAFLHNKRIQEKEAYRWEDVKEPTWNWEKFDYRVKPKYVPFKTAEELLEAQEKHGQFIYNQISTPCTYYVSRDGDVCVCDDIYIKHSHSQNYSTNLHLVMGLPVERRLNHD